MRSLYKPDEFTEDGKVKPETEEEYPVTRKTYGLESTEPVLIADMAGLFAECVVTGKKFPVTAEDGVKSLIAALAARRSAKENRPVSCEEIECNGI